MVDGHDSLPVGNRKLSHQRNMKNVGKRPIEAGEAVVQVGPRKIKAALDKPNLPETFTAMIELLQPHTEEEQCRMLEAAMILLGHK